MRFILIVGAAVFLSNSALAQQKLMMYPTFGGAHFEYEIDTAVYQVTPRQVSQILFDDPAAYREFKKARTSSTISGILGFAGAGLMIIPAATAIAGGDPEWVMLAGGAALVIASFPISANYRKRAQNALDTFNQKHSAHIIKTRFFVTGNGARLVVTF
jgi:hypothetical protein